MQALMLHANRWASRPESPSERILGCEPESLRQGDEDSAIEDLGSRHHSLRQETECLVVLFQVEKGDTDKQVRLLCRDIRKVAASVGTARLVVECFAHLSHSRADPGTAKTLAAKVLETCGGFEGYTIKTSPFGWNKGLVLDIKGHPEAFKHRSY